jgi:hypothetical protein
VTKHTWNALDKMLVILLSLSLFVAASYFFIIVRRWW